jgi:hypothetical protein
MGILSGGNHTLNTQGTMEEIFQFLFSANGLIVWIVGIIIGTVLQIAMQEWFHYSLAQRFGGWLPTSTNLGGVWRTSYKYMDKGVWKEDNPTLTVKAFGRYLTGTGISTIDGSKYTIRAKQTDDGVVTGEWVEHAKEGRYYGAFQLSISPTLSKMEGQWLGIGHNRQVKAGPWEWEKESLLVRTD